MGLINNDIHLGGEVIPDEEISLTRRNETDRSAGNNSVSCIAWNKSFTEEDDGWTVTCLARHRGYSDTDDRSATERIHVFSNNEMSLWGYARKIVSSYYCIIIAFIAI
jgi:hypothetical protein